MNTLRYCVTANILVVLQTKWTEEAVAGGTRESPQHSESVMNGIRLLNWKSTEVTSCSDALTYLKNEGVGTLPFLSLGSLVTATLWFFRIIFEESCILSCSVRGTMQSLECSDCTSCIDTGTCVCKHTHMDTCTGSFLFSLGLGEYKYLHTNMPSQKLAPGSQETPGPSLHMSEHSTVLTGK